MKKILWTALALMVISACEKDPRLNDKFWEEAPLEMEQHQFQIETEILAGLYWHWNNAYASFVEDWTPYNGEKKEPELVFSNRRWFPADAVYDHSLDDLLLVAREFGKQRRK